MFIGRERELAYLKEFYDKDGIGMTVIYGRRRIGKSTLIAEFVKDKKLYFIQRQKLEKSKFRIVFPTGNRFDDAGDGRYKLPYNGSSL